MRRGRQHATHLSREALQPNACALDDQLCATREKCASVVRAVRCSAFTHRRVHDIRQCLYAKSIKKQQSTDWQRNLQNITWRLRKSVLIRPTPANRANLVVLAIVGVPTRLSRIAIGVANVTARQSAFVGICHLGGDVCISHSFLVFSKRSGCLF